MKTLVTLTEMKTASRDLRNRRRRIGLVPTMGFLHEGHLSLVRESLRTCDATVVSIFVNPSQFAPHEDFDDYPRDIERDLDLLREEGVDFAFIPEKSEIYPSEYRTYVEVHELQEKLCGVTRPHFFRGVCTVVLKLFNIVNPDRAFFGQKDAQQAVILLRMVRDLDLEVRLEVLPVVRDENGLALSSRNVYLGPDHYPAALCLSRSLRDARALIASGESDADRIRARLEETISREPAARIDYVAVVDPETLDPLARIEDRALIAAAVFIGEVRLIDNTWIGRSGDSLEPSKPPGSPLGGDEE